MKILMGFSLLLLTLLSPTYSRPIAEHDMVSDGIEDSIKSNDPFLSEFPSPDDPPMIMCEPVHGFLPCTTNIWGILFQIVVYEILLSFGSRYATNGSNLLYQMIGPGIFGASVFQILIQIPQIVLVFVTTLSGSAEFAERRATAGMGIVTGTTVMVLTLIWGVSVVVGSYDLSTSDTSTANTSKFSLKSYGVITDNETSKSARIMLVSLIPFVFIEFSKLFGSTGRRVVILLSLLVTCALLAGYMLYQIFQPSIQNRLFEHLVSRFSKDKLLQLVSSNGRPDAVKIQQLFNKISRTNGASVSAIELRVLLVGVKIDTDDDTNTDQDVDKIMALFDSDPSGDGTINQDDFVKGISRLVSDITSTNQTNQSTTSLQQQQSTTLKKAANSWSNILQATSLLVFGTAILGFFSEPLIRSVIDFSTSANISPFLTSYVMMPFVLNYGVASQSISSARQRTERSISLTLSSLYNGVYMSNVMGLVGYLAPVFAWNLSPDVTGQVLVVLIMCIAMNMFASFWTRFPIWTGFLVLGLYPLSLGLVYLLS